MSLQSSSSDIRSHSSPLRHGIIVFLTNTDISVKDPFKSPVVPLFRSNATEFRVFSPRARAKKVFRCITC